ncbi:MAG: hypothetical protein HY737_05340 [Candidatus Omnitrophica bacterium]|nr:hypothetical protein [Candidatus Omnitrophota bacterium]
MAQRINLRVLTAEGVAIEDEAVSVIAPGEPGYVGMLCRHAPLVTTLKPGTLQWRPTASPTIWKSARIGAGLLEISLNRMTILTETVQGVG